MPIEQAAALIKQAKRMVVITGAGMSTEAGIPDFRSREGWWNNIDPMTVATVDALETNYDLFHAFYAYRLERLSNIHPTRGHQLLTDWEEGGKIRLIATQNVDGLHRAAGSQRVEELHGSINTFRCHSCRKEAGKQAFLQEKRCSCGGKLRPNVVLFGEALPSHAWGAAVKAIEAADVVLVIGTSLRVYPVNQLPTLTDGKRILINAAPTGQEDRFDVVIQKKAVSALQTIAFSL